MAFVKAAMNNKYIKMCIYGQSGTGKTYSALTYAAGLASAAGKKVGMIDTENSAGFYADLGDIDVAPAGNFMDAKKALEGFDTKVYGALVVDSVSDLDAFLIEAYEKTLNGKTIQLNDWAKIRAPMKKFLRELRDVKCHVIICGKSKDVWSDAGGTLVKAGTTIAGPQDAVYQSDIVFETEVKRHARYKTKVDYLQFSVKDRSNTVSGKTLENPTFDSIKPIVEFYKKGCEA